MTNKSGRFLLIASLALIGSSMKMAMADEWNKETIWKFPEPVQVPGKVLQPGKYSFHLLDSSSNRNIVQIYSVDENGRQKFLAMIQTVPDFLVKLSDKPVMQFEERHLGDPEAIKSWFYPGEHYGWHFIYRKSEVLESDNVVIPVAAPAPQAVPEPAIPEAPIETPDQTAVVVIERSTLITQILTPEPAEDDLVSADRVLPETASNGAAFLLGGIVIMGAGLTALYLSMRRGQPQAE